MAHWLTNKGKQLLMQGVWDDAGATAIKIGLLAGAAVPATMDTEAEIQDLATVTAFLALAGVDEPVGAWYTSQHATGRAPLVRVNAAQDDTNNRANMVAADVVWTAASAGETIYGAFWYDATVDTNDTSRLLMGVITFTPVPLNGSDFTLDITNLVQAT